MVFGTEVEEWNGNYNFSAMLGSDAVEFPSLLNSLASSICDLNCRTKTSTRWEKRTKSCGGRAEQATTLSYVNFFLGFVSYWISPALPVNKTASTQCIAIISAISLILSFLSWQFPSLCLSSPSELCISVSHILHSAHMWDPMMRKWINCEVEGPSEDIAIKPKDEYRFRVAAMLLFYFELT